MSNNDMNRTVREFYKAVEGVKSKKTGGYDVQATVRRVEDGVAWVHIPDGVDETPARLTINAKEGDVVQVRVVNGRAFLVGNASAPPTDNTEAIKALSQADIATQAATIARLKAEEATTDAARAHEAADAAQQSADDAAQAASDAQDSADAASDALQSVVTGATTVEKAVSVMQTALEAVVDYDPTTDTTKEYFWHDANGAHVLGADSGYRNDVDSSGMKIVNVNTEKTAAEFGADGAQIGETGKSHVSIDYHSLQLVDRNNNTYMHVSDLRGADGYASYADTFTGDGSTTTFYLSVVPTINTDHPMTVYVDDVETSVGGAMNIITFPTAPADGAAIRVTYYTTSTVAKAYTFGSRRTGNIGAMSFSEGSDNIAGGHASHAEGQYNAASGHWSHAEGEYCKASGAYSHAEGNGTEAQGWYSHASGDHTIAYDDYQTAIGKYNKDETDLLFAIGNGTSDSARSNAMTVDWDGVVTAANFFAGTLNIGSRIEWKTFQQTTDSAFLAAVDSAIGSDNGFLLGYMSAACSSAAGLSNVMHYCIAVANSINSRMLFVLRPTGTLYTRYKSNGTWVSGWKYVTLNTLS